METPRVPRLILPVALLSWAGLLACASVPAEEPAPPTATEALYEYEVAVTRLPAGARVLELRLVLDAGSSEVRPMRARGLVGNAAFERDFGRAWTPDGPVVLVEERGKARVIKATTAGRPLELQLRVACSGERSLEDLARALDGALTLSIDEQLQEPPDTRLRRVR